MNQSHNHARQVLQLIDLTSLNDNDSDVDIVSLCEKAFTNYGSVAAICIYSRFINTAKNKLNQLNKTLKIATVTNFPHGSPDLDIALYETKLAIERGADEVDIVFPYHSLKAGNRQIGQQMVAKAKDICKDKILKVIIESGELKTPELINLASTISIESGANFIKTSTGKVGINATLEATEIMLNAIKNSGRNCGFKAAGGIKTLNEAIKYIELTQTIMGAAWIDPDNFRFGASGLLTDVLAVLNNSSSSVNNYSSY